MPKKNGKVPNLANATPAFLVDEIGAIKDDIKALTKLEKLYRTALEARLEPGQKLVEGNTHVAMFEQQSRSSLSSEKVREILTPEQVEACTQTSHFTVMRTTKKD